MEWLKGGEQMAYYHILRQRRMDLNLTIEYVSSQTRLAPQYIQAIEEHNLDVFSDDFSFVRYFVHAYCDAIGVNWSVISQEVDADINDYARKRSMALSQAQRKIVKQMPNRSSVSKRKHSSHSRFQNRVSAISRNLQFRNRKNLQKLLLAGVALIVLAVGVSFWLDARSASQQAQQESQRQEELRQKEEETDRLAKQRQQERENQSLKFKIMDASTNVFQLSNVLETTKSFTVKIELPQESTVVIYKDDVPMDEDNVDTVYTDTFEQEIKVSEACRISIEIGNYVAKGTTITIADQTVTFDPTYWAQGMPATLYVDVVSNETATSQENQSTEETNYELTE